MVEDPLIGRKLANYRITSLIGRGGMARVYYGWDVNLQRPVAIKVIDIHQPDHRDFAKRLVLEARAVARWRHEHIIQVYYADVEDGLYYFVMEYIEGLDLGELLALYVENDELIPYEDALRIGRAVASALDYAHHQGVIHRDVKPSNVMVTGEGRIVLADFGLAMDMAQGSLGEVLGTPHYVAPEQARHSANAVPQSDLYSLGIMLYEMLTGTVPFDDSSAVSLAMQHMTEPPPLPSTLNPQLSVAVEAILLKALSKEPSDRFQTGQELIDALESALQTIQPDELTEPRVSSLSVTELVNMYLETEDTPSDNTVPRRRPSPSTLPRSHRSSTRGTLIGMTLLGGALFVGLLALIVTVVMRKSSPASLTPPETPTVPLPAATARVITGQPETTVILASPPPDFTHAPTEKILSSTPTNLSAPVLTQTTLPLTAAIVLSPTSTTLYPDGYRVLLFYNDRAFYIWNPGTRNLAMSSIAFESLDDATGLPANQRFSGQLWVEYHPVLMREHCDALEIIDPSPPPRPAECVAFNAVRTPAGTSDWLFWLPREGISQFRVLWEDQEITRCEIASGVCEVYLP